MQRQNLITIDKKWGYFWLIASLSFICIATLSPFNFAIIGNFSWQFVIDSFRYGSNLKDYWQNILLFIPFGFSLSIVITPLKNKAWIIVIIGLLISEILSTSIELIQLLLPSRVSNLTDIIYNSLGGTIGSILFSLKNSIAYFFLAIFTGNIKRLNYKSILLSILAYCSTVSIAVLVLSHSVNLSNWNDDYYLSIGNEVTGVRPWDGYIKSLYISDRNLNSSEVIKLFEQPEYFFNQTSDLVTAVVFDRYRQAYQDSSQQLPNLLWQTKENYSSIDRMISNIEFNNSIAINSQQWLKTKSPAVSLSNSLKDRGEFTISLMIASNNLEQNGPARIISLSQGVYAQNIIIGQEKADLHFRLRTPITGRNATNPEFVIPNVFKSKDFHQIIITFYDSELSFYIDKVENKHYFVFSPFTSFLVFIPWDSQGWLVNLDNFSLLKYKIAFYIIAIVPFLFFIAILLRKFAIANKNC